MTVVTSLRTAPASGGMAFRLAEVLEGVGAAIDAMGGRFPVRYTTVAVTAARTGGV